MRSTSEGLRCRQCGSAALDDLGRIPRADVFAGQPLVPPWDGGSLFACRDCALTFRHPIRSDDAHEQLYAQASAEVWVSSELRPDQQLVLGAMRRLLRPGGSVLDVGCYDGTLLAALGPSFDRCGVEASEAAGATAKQRGIRMVGRRVRDLDALDERFDLVCAVDVIEHMARPDDFLRTLVRCLSPGGSLLISTGSADAPAWREAGGCYWYCSFPEHLSFISPAWAEKTAPALGLTVADVQRFVYGDIDTSERARLIARYRRRLARQRRWAGLAGWLPRSTVERRTLRVLGRPGLFDDHILLTLTRTGVPPRA